MGIGEVEGLSVQKFDGFISDILVDAKDDWLENGAVTVGLAFTLDLVTVVTVMAMGGSSSLHSTTVEITATGLACKAKISGRLDKAHLVNHEADLWWQLHEWKRNVFDLLDLLFALLGSLLLLLGLKLSLDRVS
jgi:hypothetical protein